MRLGNPQGFGGAVYREGGKAAQKAADGFAATVIPTIQRLQAEGLSLNAIAKRLGEMGVRTARGGSWTAQAVKNALTRVVGAKAGAIGRCSAKNNI